MFIPEFPLPAILEEHLKLGGRHLTDGEQARLKALMTRLDSPRPRLWGYEQIVFQHKFWSTPAANFYLGTEGSIFIPGRVDPKRTLIIGEADEDSPIALDYRNEIPRVIYLGDDGPKSFWIELASSYEKLLEKISD